MTACGKRNRVLARKFKFQFAESFLLIFSLKDLDLTTLANDFRFSTRPCDVGAKGDPAKVNENLLTENKLSPA